MKFDTSCLKLKQLIESFTPDEKIKKRQRGERASATVNYGAIYGRMDGGVVTTKKLKSAYNDVLATHIGTVGDTSVPNISNVDFGALLMNAGDNAGYNGMYQNFNKNVWKSWKIESTYNTLNNNISTSVNVSMNNHGYPYFANSQAMKNSSSLVYMKNHGTGKDTAPFQIVNQSMFLLVNKISSVGSGVTAKNIGSYRVENDIYCTPAFAGINNLRGTLNGNGKIIYNLELTPKISDDRSGFIRNNHGELKTLTFKDSKIIITHDSDPAKDFAGDAIGIVCAYNAGTISSVSVEDAVINYNSNTAGQVFGNTHEQLSIGGFVGHNAGTVGTGCSISNISIILDNKSIPAPLGNVGGFVGYNQGAGSQGSVVKGIQGQSGSKVTVNNVTITNTVGTMNGFTNIGGFAGKHGSGNNEITYAAITNAVINVLANNNNVTIVNLGGFVGDSAGNVANCELTGLDMHITRDEINATTPRIYVGGFVGCARPAVTNSTVYGSIAFTGSLGSNSYVNAFDGWRSASNAVGDECMTDINEKVAITGLTP